MSRFSRTLARLVETDPRVESYDHDSDGHWIILAEDYNIHGGRIVHVETLAEMLEILRQSVEKGEADN